MLSHQQFDRARRLASRLAGIELVERHRPLLHRRSRRLGIGDDAGLDALLTAAEGGEVSATQTFLRLLTTKFTGFFRHPHHFELATEQALRATRERGLARLWSAGTATGEEAWSLAMALVEGLGRDDPPVRILATDVDVDALASAQRAAYGGASLRTLSAARRERFFRESSAAQGWGVAPGLRHLVEFRILNLAGQDWPVEGPFDVVFCRNVLMYLEVRHRHAALERIASLLAPDGLLMLDPTEHPGPAECRFTPGAKGVYSVRHDPGHHGRQLPPPMRMLS